MQTNDALWQGAIEDLPFEFIKKFYPNLYPYIDFEHENPIEFLDKELAQLHENSDFGLKRVDKLLGVHLKGISDMRMLYVHVEAQGYTEKLFPKRNFIYYYRLYDLHGENVTVLVLLTDTNPMYKPSVYTLDFMGVHLTYKFPVYKIMEQNPNALADSDNLFDAALLTAYWAIQKKRGQLSDEDLMELKLNLIRRLLSKNVDKNKIRKLFDFIKQYFSFEKPEITATFEREFNEINKFGKNMGITEILIEQGVERGLQRGLQLGLTEAETRIRNDRKNTVSNMRRKNYSAESIADILDYPLIDVETFFKELDKEK
jgi:hypothetical protein